MGNQFTADGNENQSRDYRNELLTKIGAWQQTKSLLPTVVSDLMFQLKDVSPDDVDMGRCTQEQRDAFSKLTYNRNIERWFYDGDFDFRSEFLSQVDEINRELGSNPWTGLYGFIQAGYDIEATKTWIRANFIGPAGRPFGIVHKDDGWRIVFEKVNELPEIKTYRPPADYRVTRQQPSHEEMMRMMMGGHSHEHKNDSDTESTEDDEERVQETDQEPNQDLPSEKPSEPSVSNAD